MRHITIEDVESYLQKLIAIGGRAQCAIQYIEKGRYQKAKHYVDEILKIAEEEILKLTEEHK